MGFNSFDGGGGTYFGPWAQWVHLYAQDCGQCVEGHFPSKAWRYVTSRPLSAPRSGSVPMCDHQDGDCSGGDYDFAGLYMYGPCVRKADLGRNPPPMGDFSASCSGSAGPCLLGNRRVSCRPVYYWCRDGGVIETNDCGDEMDERYGCCGPYCTSWEAETEGRRECDVSSSYSSESSESSGLCEEVCGAMGLVYVRSLVTNAYDDNVWVFPDDPGILGQVWHRSTNVPWSMPNVQWSCGGEVHTTVSHTPSLEDTLAQEGDWMCWMVERYVTICRVSCETDVPLSYRCERDWVHFGY